MPCGGRINSSYSIVRQIIDSCPLASLSSFLVFGNRVPLKPVLGGMAGVADFITDHEKTQ